MAPEMVRNIQENLLGGKIEFAPTFGNALVGLAPSRKVSTFSNPIGGQRPYSVIYQPFEPHTVLRITKPGSPKELIDYGQRGRVVIYTLSNEFLIPGMVERDEAERVMPTIEHPSDGVCEVGPPAELRGTNVGVY